MNRSLLVCIIGVDGTGKTSHTKLLVDRLTNEGLAVKYLWAGFFHFFSLPLLAYARIMGFTEVEKVTEERFVRHYQFYESRFLSKFYPISLFIDTLISTFLRVNLQLLLGKVVICDRFIYDTFVHLMMTLRNPALMHGKIARLYFRLMPKNNIVIVLRTKQLIAMHRREDLIEEKYWNYKAKLYEMIAQELNLLMIDTDGSINSVHRKLYTTLKQK
ncbi:MAG: hypothetical protein PVH73_05805 [Candidatus Bathyarchaeota archaeon]